MLNELAPTPSTREHTQQSCVVPRKRTDHGPRSGLSTSTSYRASLKFRSLVQVDTKRWCCVRSREPPGDQMHLWIPVHVERKMKLYTLFFLPFCVSLDVGI